MWITKVDTVGFPPREFRLRGPLEVKGLVINPAYKSVECSDLVFDNLIVMFCGRPCKLSARQQIGAIQCLYRIQARRLLDEFNRDAHEIEPPTFIIIDVIARLV